MPLRTTLLALCAATSLPAAALAQSNLDAPIPSRGTLVRSTDAVALPETGANSNLPGVGSGARDADRTIYGPGGLANGVGAIGSGPPSTSSHNPVTLDPGSTNPLGLSFDGGRS